MTLPLVIGALALLPACVPAGLVGTHLHALPEEGGRSAFTAAQEAVRLEPGPPPQPLPAIRPPEEGEARDAREPEAVASASPALARPQPDIWERMRRQFTIPRPPLARVQHQADWFRRNPDYFDRVAERSRDYLPYIVHEAERRGIPVELALLPVIESAFQPFAYSPARASGLWQFIPSTARLYGLRINWWYDGRRDLVASTSAAFEYLEKLHRDFGGDWLLAVAAYNWGEGNLRRAIARNRERGKPIDFWSLKVPAETRTYVPRWLAVCDIVAQPDHYGMTLRRVPDEVTFRVVEVDGQIDLARAAELANISLDRLYRLNAGYRRWATEPKGPQRLLVPAPSAEAFARRVALLSPEHSSDWGHHVVVAGDTLSEIAVRYGTSVAALAHQNRLKGSLIRVGERLLIPGKPAEPGSPPSGSETSRRLASTEVEIPGHESASRHRVRKGENLWLIARRYGIPIANLVAWNRLDPEAWLMPGQMLHLRASTSEPMSIATRDEETERYVVRNGDNLWLIARRHGVSIVDLRTWNALSPDEWLMPGQILALSSSAERTPPAPSTASRSQGSRNRYVVRDGDSLWVIARRRGVSVEDLRAWNGPDLDDRLMPGQILKLDGPAAPSASSAAPGGTYQSYLVRNGDNLWLIARRIGVSVDDLRAWNGLEPAEWLMPGQTLLLRDPSAAPASNLSGGEADDEHRYVVRSGDSLWLIARRHSISTEQLASWNELSINGVLQPGQTLQVAPPAPDTGDAPATNSL